MADYAFGSNPPLSWMTRMTPLRKAHPKNVGAGTVGGFQGNNVGRIGLNCKF